MSCQSAAPQNQSRLRTIGPPNSPETFEILLSGAPDRNPPAPVSNNSGVTFIPCMASFSKVPTADPLNVLLPLFVTRLMERPLDWTETSPPPLTT